MSDRPRTVAALFWAFLLLGGMGALYSLTDSPTDLKGAWNAAAHDRDRFFNHDKWEKDEAERRTRALEEFENQWRHSIFNSKHLFKNNLAVSRSDFPCFPVFS